MYTREGAQSRARRKERTHARTTEHAAEREKDSSKEAEEHRRPRIGEREREQGCQKEERSREGSQWGARERTKCKREKDRNEAPGVVLSFLQRPPSPQRRRRTPFMLAAVFFYACRAALPRIWNVMAREVEEKAPTLSREGCRLHVPVEEVRFCLLRSDYASTRSGVSRSVRPSSFTVTMPETLQDLSRSRLLEDVSLHCVST